MPVVTFHNEHRSIDADAGTNLRELMLRIGVSPYRGLDVLTNCRGHNFCGTCAVVIVDGKGASPRTQEEETTLGGNLAIARLVEKNMRLACQTKITGDLIVKTHPIRTIDPKETKQRLVGVAIGAFFIVIAIALVSIRDKINSEKS